MDHFPLRARALWHFFESAPDQLSGDGLFGALQLNETLGQKTHAPALFALGGSEQARAIRWASCSASSLGGLVALGLRWTSAASNPSQANLWRTRATVERLISRASAILVSGQEEASLGASSPSSALSRMRAWVNWRAGAWPPAIKPSSLPRSSLDKLTGLFLFLGIERPPHVRCRAVARTSGGTHHTREGILLQTNHVRTLACSSLRFASSWLRRTMAEAFTDPDRPATSRI